MLVNIIPRRPYGNTEILVSSAGLGAAQIGNAGITEAEVNRLLNHAIDAGITLLDTAPSYGLSERRIGQHLARRRNDFVLSTKLGYGVDGTADWTGQCITAGVEQALRIMQTDRIDIAHLHSCSKATLERDDVIDALELAKRQGKVRAIAYSGDNEDLVYAIATGRFDGFMASLNLCDQGLIKTALPRMGNKGFIAKRPAANHPWRFDQLPVGEYCEEYWRRWQAMKIDHRDMPWGELALRFTLSIPRVCSAIVGTANRAHLLQNIQWAAKGPLDKRQVEEIQSRFQLHGDDWRGEV
ncbi:MAG: aldo/keto reductase [Burkholderiales bacterium]